MKRDEIISQVKKLSKNIKKQAYEKDSNSKIPKGNRAYI